MLQGSLKAGHETIFNLKEKAENERNNLNLALTSNGFETQTEVEKYLKSDAERELIKNKIATWETEKLKLETNKISFFDLIKDKTKPDISSLKIKLDEKENLYKNCLTLLTSQNNILGNLQRVKTKIAELNENFSGFGRTGKTYLPTLGCGKWQKHIQTKI